MDSETRNMKSKTIIGFWLFIGWDLLIPGWARNISRGFKRLIFCQLPTQSCSFLGVQLQHKQRKPFFMKHLRSNFLGKSLDEQF